MYLDKKKCCFLGWSWSTGWNSKFLILQNIEGIRISTDGESFCSFICEFQWNSTFYQVGGVFGTEYTSKRTTVKYTKTNYIHCTRLHSFCVCVRRLYRSFGQLPWAILIFFEVYSSGSIKLILVVANIQKSINPGSLYWSIPIFAVLW